jgi:hypothetical protein
VNYYEKIQHNGQQKPLSYNILQEQGIAGNYDGFLGFAQNLQETNNSQNGDQATNCCEDDCICDDGCGTEDIEFLCTWCNRMPTG